MDQHPPEHTRNLILLFIGLLLVTTNVAAFYLVTQLKEQNNRLTDDLNEKTTKLAEYYSANVVAENTPEVKGASDEETGTPIEGVQDCPEYQVGINGEESARQEVQGQQFIQRRFISDPNQVGWCLYHLQGEDAVLIGGGPNHRGIEVIAFAQGRYVVYGGGCGTECYLTNVIDIYDPSYDNVLNTSPYFELSSDSQWIIFYYRQLYADEETDVTSDLGYQYMAEAVDLNTFQSYWFAKNPYVNGSTIDDFNAYLDYRIEFNSSDIDFFDEFNQLVSIPFYDRATGEISIRTFDLNANFSEVR